MIRNVILGLSAATAAGLLFVNVYNSLIDAANWSSALPDSVVAARQYFSVANPGNFFRIFSPINQVLALVAVLLVWKQGGRARYMAIGSLVLAVAADVLTFGYFYPRNEILFTGPLTNNMETLRQAAEQWTSMNWFRSVMCSVNTFLAFTILVITSKKSVS
jgi:uncharacterized membrane protein